MPLVPQLPDLPLMLAGVPHAVPAMLRDAGVPAHPLPRVPLAAAGIGRFVLFDSRNPRSAATALRAERDGLEAVDVAALMEAAESGTLPAAPPPEHSTVACAGLPRATADDTTEAATTRNDWLHHLKYELEQRGGIWARIADYPFPYQGALAAAVEHDSDAWQELGDLEAALRGRATHFVSSRLRSQALLELSRFEALDLGWSITPRDCESTTRRTLSHWQTRRARFGAAGLVPEGLLVHPPAPRLPASRALEQLGFRFCCQIAAGAPDRALACARDGWTRFFAWTATALARAPGGLAHDYLAARPVMVTASTARMDEVRDLLRLDAEAAGYALLWRTSPTALARWWRMKRGLDVQVFRRGTGTTVHLAQLDAASNMALELWRGDHFAVVPLRTELMELNDDGLIFQQARGRSPAGLVAAERWKPDRATRLAQTIEAA